MFEMQPIHEIFLNINPLIYMTKWEFYLLHSGNFQFLFCYQHYLMGEIFKKPSASSMANNAEMLGIYLYLFYICREKHKILREVFTPLQPEMSSNYSTRRNINTWMSAYAAGMFCFIALYAAAMFLDLAALHCCLITLYGAVMFLDLAALLYYNFIFCSFVLFFGSVVLLNLTVLLFNVCIPFKSRRYSMIRLCSTQCS